jgi:HAD superfamily hydrolase (TIGR01484 family)
MHDTKEGSRVEGHLDGAHDCAWLLASDLDGTLIPTRDDPGGQAAIRVVADLRLREDLLLAYVTGRHLELARAGIAAHGLPVPDAIAADVGTTLYWRSSDGYEPDTEYLRYVEGLDGVPRADAVSDVLEGVAGLRLQEGEKQGRFKTSYYFDGDFSISVLRHMQDRLSAVGRVRLVHSRDPVSGVGLLDVLPAEVGKETAVRFLASELGKDDGCVVFAGDSGNDRAAFLMGNRAVVVGNAADDLKAEIREAVAERGLDELVYFAEASFSAGVVEGLAHHGVPGRSR